jgi:hypothetical protein
MLNNAFRERSRLLCVLTAMMILPLVISGATNASDNPAAGNQSAQIVIDKIPDVKVKVPSQDVLAFKIYENVKITALDNPWPPDNCLQSKWTATVANNNQNAVSDLFLEGFVFLENQQTWTLSITSSVFSIEGKQSKTIEGRWYPGPFDSKYKLVLRQKKLNITQPEERVINLVIPATANLEILQPVFPGDSWRVSVKNNGARAECAIAITTYLIKQSTGERKAVGGLGLKIPPNSVDSAQNTIQEPDWRKKFDKIEVLLRRAPTWKNTPGPGWTDVKRQTFSIAP